MENLFIKETKLTPEVSFDLALNVFTIKGNSIPENSNNFFFPLIDWLEDNTHAIATNNKKLHVIVDLTYFNSSSLKQLIKIFMLCIEIVTPPNIKITWHCDNASDDFMETGEDISNALNVPFEYIFRK